MVSMEILGERVRIHMARKRLNQSDLCKKGGFGKALVNRIYNGRALRTMSLATLERLAEALEVKLVDLIEERNTTDSSPASRDSSPGKRYNSPYVGKTTSPSPCISQSKLREGVLFNDCNDGLPSIDPLGIKLAANKQPSRVDAEMRR